MNNKVPELAQLCLWAGLALGPGFSVASAQDAAAWSAAGLEASAAGEVIDLSRAWRSALQYDHTYRAAISERAAAQTERDQGRAALLPQIMAGYSRSNVSGDMIEPNFAGQRIGSDVSYDSTNAYVQLQQPIINLGRYAEYRHGSARADLGDATFAVKQQEAAIRLATAYFNALFAHDKLTLQRSLADSLAGQAKGLEARYQQNEGTLTEVQETQARLAIARADVIDADDELVVATRELQALLGAAPVQLKGLDADFPTLPLQPASLQAWLDRARANNAQVRAARGALTVAEAEVDRAASRYLPTMDLVTSYGKADSENIASLSQRSNTFVIGIQVNIPIFTGGYNTANVARARAERKRAQHELDAALERTQAEVTRQYTQVVGGAERITALQTAVESSTLSLESAQRGFELGATSNLDVLKAQDQLYRAKYELVRTRLEYLLSRLTLASAAGDLRSGEFDQINDTYLGRVVQLASN